MAPLLFYVPIAALAITSLYAILGPIDSKLAEISESRCKKIIDEMSKGHTDTKLSMEEILDVCDVSWKIREIKQATYRDTVRATWASFGLLASSVAGLGLSLAETIVSVQFYIDLIIYTDVIIVGIFVVLLPFLARIIRQSLQKST